MEETDNLLTTETRKTLKPRGPKKRLVITTYDLAEHFGVTPQTIRNWICEGDLELTLKGLLEKTQSNEFLHVEKASLARLLKVDVKDLDNLQSPVSSALVRLILIKQTDTLRAMLELVLALVLSTWSENPARIPHLIRGKRLLKHLISVEEERNTKQEEDTPSPAIIDRPSPLKLSRRVMSPEVSRR